MRNSKLLAVILAALPACSDEFGTTGCLDVPKEQTTCPPSAEVDKSKLSVQAPCSSYEVREVTGEGQLRTTNLVPTGAEVTQCCYPIRAVDLTPDAHCVDGRPYLEGDQVTRAPLARNPTPQPPRARAWAEAGAAEHASVAAFSRLALQLLAHGAPTTLLADVHRAALDELAHTELCFRLSAELGGGEVTAGAFPFRAPVQMAVSLAELATAAVREGCLSETLGAHVASVAAEIAPDPRVREALRTIADDEARHAALSFRIVAWALSLGGHAVREAVLETFAEPLRIPSFAELAVRAGVDAEELQRAALDGVSEVLQPAAQHLFKLPARS